MQITSEAPTSFRTSAFRPSAISLIRTAVEETLSRRRLIRYLVRAELKKKGSDTVLGNVWWILDPLLAMMVYVVVMTVIFARKTPDFPIFLLAALIPFKWFTAAIGDSTISVVSKGQLIKQIQFPKIILPVTTNVAELVNLGFGMLVLIGVMLIVYPAHFSAMLLFVPVIIAVQFVFTMGLVLIISAVTVFYRDVGNVIGHIMRLLFFLSPILWSFDALGAGRGAELEHALGSTGFAILQYNPLSIFLDAYRHSIYGIVNSDGLSWSAPVAPNLWMLGWVLGLSLVLCAIGALVFKRLEPTFAKVL